MFPLKQRTLIRGAAAHIAAGLGAAADYVAPTGTEYYAPFTGTLSIPYGPNGQGGIWLRLTRTNGDKIEVAHLKNYIKSSGGVNEGELVAITDNTGKLTSGPHAHIQIIDKNGKRLDPEKYDWGSNSQGDTSMYDKGVTLQALVPGNFYETPSPSSKINASYGKGDLGEVDSVLTPDGHSQVSTGNWLVLSSAGVKYGWVEKDHFKAVPRASVPNEDTKKLADAKEKAKQIQGISSQIINL